MSQKAAKTTNGTRGHPQAAADGKQTAESGGERRVESRALWLSLLGTAVMLLAFTWLVWRLVPPAAPGGRVARAAQQRLLQRRIMLEARVRLCAMEDRGEISRKRQACPPKRRAALPKYRREITRINQQLGLLRPNHKRGVMRP